MSRSHALTDFPPPPCGSCKNGCKSSIWQHMCLPERLAVPLAAVATPSPSCRGTGEAHSCTGTLVGTGFLGPWATLLQKRGWLLGGSAAACIALPGQTPWPPFAHGLLRIFSRWAAAAPVPPARLSWQTLCKPLGHPLPPHSRPCLPPASQGCHWHRELAWCSGSDLPCRCTPQVFQGCCTKSGSGAHPDEWYLHVPCGPLRKPIYHISPGEKKKKREASGADVVLQRWG